MERAKPRSGDHNRKAAENPLLRGLLVPVGSSGYVMLYKIVDQEHVTIMAVRHQLEDDYH